MRASLPCTARTAILPTTDSERGLRGETAQCTRVWHYMEIIATKKTAVQPSFCVPCTRVLCVSFGLRIVRGATIIERRGCDKSSINYAERSNALFIF